MPSNVNAVHVGSVHLDAALLLRPVLASKLRTGMPHYVDVVNGGLVLLQGRRSSSSCTHTRQPRTSSMSLLRSQSSQHPSSSPPQPPSSSSTLTTICPFGTFGIFNTSTLLSVRQFGQVPSHPFPHALCHVVLQPLQTSAAIPLPLPQQLFKQKGQPKGPSGECSIFTFIRGGSKLFMLLMLHPYNNPAINHRGKSRTIAAQSIPSSLVLLFSQHFLRTISPHSRRASNLSAVLITLASPAAHWSRCVVTNSSATKEKNVDFHFALSLRIQRRPRPLFRQFPTVVSSLPSYPGHGTLTSSARAQFCSKRVRPSSLIDRPACHRIP